MSHGAYRFREGEMIRAISAAKRAGLDVQRIDVHPDGTYSIIPVAPLPSDFDRELDREFATFNLRAPETVPTP